MSNVGQLNANLTLGNAQFTAALEESQNRTGKFQSAVGGGTGSFVKFNTHMLESRRTMRLLGDAAGAHLGQVTHFIHAFGMFGPIAGAAVVGFILLQDYIKGTAEKLKHANEANKSFYESLRNIRLEADKLEFNKAARELSEIGKQTAKVREEMLDLKQGGFWRDVGLNLASLFVKVMPGTHVQTPEERERQIQRDPRYQELQAQMNLLQARARLTMEDAREDGKEPGLEKKKGERHAGGTTPHILRAVQGEELGALKLEHSNPMVDLLRKIVDVETKILAVVQRPNDPRPNVIHNHPTPEVGLRLDF